MGEFLEDSVCEGGDGHLNFAKYCRKLSSSCQRFGRGKLGSDSESSEYLTASAPPFEYPAITNGRSLPTHSRTWRAPIRLATTQYLPADLRQGSRNGPVSGQAEPENIESLGL